MNVDQVIAELLKQDSQAEVYILTAPLFDAGDSSIGRYLAQRHVAEIGVQEGSHYVCILSEDAVSYLQEADREEGA